MGKEERLRKTSQFREVYQRGKAWVCGPVVLKALPNGLGYNRFGFVVNKRLGNAVKRNRVKRLMREAARSVNARAGWDLVFIARGEAGLVNYHQLRAEIIRLMQRAKILEDQGEKKNSGEV